MSVDKRTDILTDASLHYGEHLLHRFGKNKQVPSQNPFSCDGKCSPVT